MTASCVSLEDDVPGAVLMRREALLCEFELEMSMIVPPLGVFLADFLPEASDDAAGEGVDAVGWSHDAECWPRARERGSRWTWTQLAESHMHAVQIAWPSFRFWRIVPPRAPRNTAIEAL